ncbi:methyl-accepting chemotaxis protein [Halomonas sp. E14]|uniref:methyl-accepting chemotaxis protein n=1 Tax=Halomonas sp. E14 TaxID=3397245 RepID=UPI00403EB799
MSDHQAVTQREYSLDEQHLLITRSDLEGRITYANKAFVEVSGYDLDELIGAPHRLIRHPDMPAQAFADLWQTIKRGGTWQGVVKNRRKNGDHYWVHATVTPILEGKVCHGYTSVRTVATAEEVAAAERAYRQLRDGRGSTALHQGRLVRRGPLGWLARLNVRTLRAKLITMTVVPVLLLLLSGGVGFYGLKVSGERVQQLNVNGVQDIANLQRIDQLLSQLMIDLERPVRNPRSLRPEQMDALAQEVDEVVETMQDAWQRFLAGEEAQQGSVAELSGQLDRAIAQGIQPAMDALLNGSGFVAYEAYNEVLRPEANAISQSINVLIEGKLVFANQLAVQAERGQLAMLMGQAIAVAGSILFLFLLGFWTLRAVIRPVREAEAFTLQIATGNLAVSSPQRRHDEIGALLRALDTMRKSLYSTTDTIRKGIDVVTPATRAIAQSNEDLSSRTEQQAASLQQTASSMEEMTATVRQNTDNARQASGLALDNAGRVQETGELMHGVVETMQRITAGAEKMKQIINVIDSIAFQTNILALNASVEAARAGEQGRGFAVVAGEVRNLAGRSAEAAKEIRRLIDGSADEILQGASQVERAERAMAEVVAASARVNDIMGEITAASEEQSSGIGQINQAITEMDQVTQQNAERVQHSARAASDLRRQAELLEQAIRAFRLRDAGQERVEALASPAEAARDSRAGAEHAMSRHGDPLPARRAPARAARVNDEEWETF